MSSEFGFKPSDVFSESDLLSSELKAGRLKRKVSIRDVSRKLGIRPEYLEAIEKGQYSLLPVGVYGRKFVEEYASFLRVDKSMVQAVIDEDFFSKVGNKDFFSKKVIKQTNFLILPKIIKNFLVFLLVLVCFSYLGWYLKRVFSPPYLDVSEPKDNFVTKEELINVSGYAEKEAEVSINGEPVLSSESGFFTKKVSLKNGVNTVRISANKKYGQKKIIDRQILVNK